MLTKWDTTVNGHGGRAVAFTRHAEIGDAHDVPAASHLSPTAIEDLGAWARTSCLSAEPLGPAPVFRSRLRQGIGRARPPSDPIAGMPRENRLSLADGFLKWTSESKAAQDLG
jgi:hypothetical protein